MRDSYLSSRRLSLGFKLFLMFALALSGFLFKLNNFAYSAAGDVTLTASSFSDTDAEDTFNASQWVIRNSEGTVYDQVLGAITTTTVPAATFVNGTTYWWKVRYQDQHLVWSDYSAESSFAYGTGDPDTPTPIPDTPTPEPSSSVSLTPTPSVSSTPFCQFGWQDFDHDGVQTPEECGDVTAYSFVYMDENFSDFCTSSFPLTFYYTSDGYTLSSGIWQHYLSSKTYDVYLSIDGGSVYNRVASSLNMLTGASQVSDLPLPLKAEAEDFNLNNLVYLNLPHNQNDFIKVTRDINIPDGMISEGQNARFLVNIHDNNVDEDLGSSFVFNQSQDWESHAFYGSSTALVDFTNIVQSKACAPVVEVTPSPIPSPVSSCSYTFSSPKRGDKLPSQKISDILWSSNNASTQDEVNPSTGSTSTFPKANLYLSVNNGSTFNSIASDLSGNSYSYYFGKNDVSTRAKLRIDHYNESGIFSSCYSDLFSVTGAGGVGTGGFGGTNVSRTVSNVLVLGSLLASLLSWVLTSVASIPFLQRLANTFFSIFAPPAWAGKQPAWGFVYDSVTKRPLKDVILRVFAEPSGRLKSSIKSNINGAFGFILPEGKYSIIASLMGFDFPSKLIIGNTDGKFLSVYKGGVLDVAGDGQQKAQVNVNVPMDRVNLSTFDIIQVRTLATIARFFQAIRIPIFILGTLSEAYLLFTQHRTIDYVIGVIYLALWYLEIKHMLKKKAYGMVRDTAGSPLSMALIRVMDQRGKLKFTSATGEDGKFQLFLDPGTYRLDVSRGGYRSIKTEMFKIDKIQDIGRLELRLQKL